MPSEFEEQFKKALRGILRLIVPLSTIAGVLVSVRVYHVLAPSWYWSFGAFLYFFVFSVILSYILALAITWVKTHFLKPPGKKPD
jgi:hypothetical protein